MTSVEAANLLNNIHLESKRYFDIVFVDADHLYNSVKEDILTWIPHVKEGGMLAGHDYGGRHRGVKKAVDEIFGLENIEIIQDIWVSRII